MVAQPAAREWHTGDPEATSGNAQGASEHTPRRLLLSSVDARGGGVLVGDQVEMLWAPYADLQATASGWLPLSRDLTYLRHATATESSFCCDPDGEDMRRLEMAREKLAALRRRCAAPQPGDRFAQRVAAIHEAAAQGKRLVSAEGLGAADKLYDALSPARKRANEGLISDE